MAEQNGTVLTSARTARGTLMSALATLACHVDSRHAGRDRLASSVPGRQLRLRHQLASVRRNR